MKKKKSKKKNIKKTGPYVCVVCGQGKKVSKGTICCGEEMLSKEGVWAD